MKRYPPLRRALLHLNLKHAIAGPLAIALIAAPEAAFAVHRSFDPEARNWTDGPFYGVHGTFFADVTGDGAADVIAVNDDRIWFRRSDRSNCRFGPNEPLTQTPFFGSEATFFADVTGDGKADPIAINHDRVTVRRSEDSRRIDWIKGPFSGELTTAFADVTGDGKADAIAVYTFGIVVRRSNGADAFGPDENWSMGSYYGSRGTYFADVTGDRRADAIAVNDSEVTVRESRLSTLFNREGFDLSVRWTPDPYYGNRENHFADATGDRKADAIVVNDDGVAVRDSLGNGFRSPDPTNHLVTAGDAVIRPWGYWTLDPFYGTRGTFFADVNGDFTADAIAVNDDGVWIRRARFTSFFSSCPT